MPTEQRDFINVTGGQVFGLGGPDEFTWVGGNATIHGGDTNEAYDSNVYGDRSGGDVLILDRDAPGARLRLSTTEDGHVLANGARLDFTGIERIHLTDGGDKVNGGAAAMDRHPLSIYSYGGDDTINGGAGGDFIDPGAGDDKVFAGAGDDFVQASRGSDLIYGGAGNDNIRWGQGTAEGNAGSGLAYGNDTLFGGVGEDLVNLWAHDWDGTGVAVRIDHVRADGAMRGTGTIGFTGVTETVRFQGFEQGWTHEGRDTIDGSGAVVAGDAGLRWNARWGNDVLVGTAGRDTLEGGDGADTITGGAGDDLLVGGGDYWNTGGGQDGSADAFVFRGLFGADTIQGFEVGLDRLDFGGAVTARDTAAGTILTADGGTVLLIGVHDFDI